MNLGPPSRMQRCLTAIRNSDQNVLYWDCFNASLRAWKWPLDSDHNRIPPADLVGHRESHCHYIASCADGGCEYAVNLERAYVQEELLTKFYGTRYANDPAPAAISVTNRAHLSQVSIRRMHARSIAVYHPPAPVAPTPFSLLLRLDSHSQPGITLEQFLGLFVQCASCRLVMTMGATNVHNCAVPAGEQGPGGVIDLTEDSD
ncbi:hypothetical protein BV25DRAFT_1843119 [Artomyces pyxidatus]|uniref:Uncharacterized protein n=1 Tax=Artomyces pyxidatus TaxID=48021 RepID=A0ACB8SGN8_9AGAM|nr:hypothetical protein BV25DRAFT_1843119 [Artomyces pyxidatus]